MIWVLLATILVSVSNSAIPGPSKVRKFFFSSIFQSGKVLPKML
jgi:hypothetical protein